MGGVAKKPPCKPERKVTWSKCEKRNPKLAQHWKQLFKEIDEEAAIPPDHREEVVAEFLPDHLFEAVKGVLKFKPDPNKKILPREHHDSDEESMVSRSTIISHMEDLFIPQRVKSLYDITISDAKSRKTGSTIAPEKKRKGNPYINFLTKSDRDACRWRKQPPVDYMRKPLIEKAEIITNNIVNDFCSWLRAMGGSGGDCSRLNEKAIHKMFRIGSDTHASKALCIQMKEMASVPIAVAHARNQPEVGQRAVLRHNLSLDVTAERTPKRVLAFGTALPAKYVYIPPRNQTFDRWIKCHFLRPELVNMAAVWHNITDLRSTRAFCNWLIDHPDLERPAYLEENGFLRPEVANAARFSIDTQDSVGGIAPIIKKPK